MGQTTGSPQSSVDRLILEQRRYYDLRADDYADLTRPSDRAKRGVLGGALAEALVEELRPSGTVLELAAGSGAFTRLLADRAAALTVVDGSERMLELNRRLVARDDVEYVHADLFEWRPARRYDIVFFGFWLSHVPPTHFRRFWDLVRSCLAPHGRVGFVDEDGRGVVNEQDHSDDGVPTARRRLSDGRAFEIVKIFWDPAELQAELESLGWAATVRPVGDTFLYGHCRPR